MARGDARQLGLRGGGVRGGSGGTPRLLALPGPAGPRGPRRTGEAADVSRRAKLLAGALVIAGALGYLVVTGVRQSVVYFVTPSELGAAPVAGKAYRLGGMVAPGSLRWEPATLDLSFTLTDGKASVPVRHKGTAP